MTAALSFNGSLLCGGSGSPSKAALSGCAGSGRWTALQWPRIRCWGLGTIPCRGGPGRRPPAAGLRADDSSAPFEMTVESALKLLGVSESASFDEILRAKNAVLASCKEDMKAAAQVEAAYDMLLMQRLSQRRAGKVANSAIRYADVKQFKRTVTGAMPEWLQKTVKNIPVSVEAPTTSNLVIQAGVYGALMVFTVVSGSAPTSAGSYAGADVPGVVIATSIGASLYFLSKKRVGLGKAALISIGGLVVGAGIGSVVEQWLQVDIVPFYGIQSPAVIVSEFILFSQLLVSLYLR